MKIVEKMNIIKKMVTEDNIGLAKSVINYMLIEITNCYQTINA